MDIFSQIEDLIEKEEYERAEKTCISIFLQLPHVEKCIPILTDIYNKTGNLNFVNKPLNNKTYFLCQAIADNLYKISPNKAIEFCKILISKTPDIPYFKEKTAEFYLDLGFNYIKQDSCDKAKESFDSAFEFDFNKIIACVKLTTFCRDNNLNFEPQYNSKAIGLIKPYIKLWDGTLQKDKTLLLYSSVNNEGFGDNIMNIRSLCYIKDYFKKIKVFCQPQLTELFKNSFDNVNDCIIEFFDNIEDINEAYDYCAIAEISIQTDISDINKLPDKYLKTTNEKIEYFRNKYFSSNKPKFGICWKGNIHQGWEWSKDRSIPLSTLSELFKFDNLQFYSIQKSGYEEIENYPNVINLAHELNNFDDTLAAMSNLDLMITIDTSIVHLAGAAGIKTFLMLNKIASYVWCNKDKPNLYDSLERFQQEENKNWQDVIEKIKERLISMYY